MTITLRGSVLDRVAYLEKDRLKANRRNRDINRLVNEHYELFPMFVTEDKNDLYFSGWESQFNITIPWNPLRFKEMVAELESYGWEQVNTEAREPTSRQMSINFQHPTLKLEGGWKKYGWRSKEIDLDLTMKAEEPDDDGKLPATQNCHVVEIGREIQTIEKEIITYDIICDESYQELMEGVNGNSELQTAVA